MRSLKGLLAVALVGGAVGIAGPAAAQERVCPPLRNGITVTVAGQDVEIPGHGVQCVYLPTVQPEVYDDNGTTVVRLGDGGSRTCMFGVNGNCLVALEI